ncbi:MAG: YqaA family protein [Candidatus Nitrosocaldaceae archaeon]
MINDIVEWAKEFFVSFGEIGLFIVAFAESSVFPIPPDIILIALALLNPNLSLYYSLIASIGSVLGGIGGYYIGMKGGRRIAKRIFKERLLNKVDEYFNEYGTWTVFIAAFSPIPYKVFTIGAGIARFNLKRFIIASVIGRSARFVAEGIIIMFWGKEILDFALTNFELITITVTAAIIGYIIIKKFRSSK